MILAMETNGKLKYRFSIKNLWLFARQKIIGYRVTLILIVFIAFIIFVFIFPFRYAKNQEDLLAMLPNLMTATSIIVAILVGYLFIRFSNIREIRRERLDRYIELQEELYPYQEAFYKLAISLGKQHDIQLQWERDYFELLKDIKFLEDDSRKPNATLFIRALERVGKRHWDYRDPEISRKLIAPEELDSIKECLTALSGTLCREKHYKPVLSELGVTLDDFSKIVITYNGDPSLKKCVEKLDNESNMGVDSLAFWEVKINKALDITERMWSNAGHIFFYTAKKLKILFGELSSVMIFGLFLPLIVLSFKCPMSTSYYLSYASLVGFILSFVSVIITIYKEISSKQIVSIE